jgi:hypothetical protein
MSMYRGFALLTLLTGLALVNACVTESEDEAAGGSGASSGNGSGGSGTGGNSTSTGGTDQGTAGTDGNDPSIECPTGTVQDMDGNDTSGSAQVVGACQTFKGSLPEGDEKDYIKVTIPAGNEDGWLTVTITEPNDNYDVNFELLHGSKAHYGMYYAGGTDPFIEKFPVVPGKTYYLVFSGSEGAQYEAKLNFTPVKDPFEPNDTFATAKTLELDKLTDLVLFAGIDHEPESEADADIFQVTVPANSTKLNVTIDNTCPADQGISPTVELLDAQKRHVAIVYTANAQADLNHSFDLLEGETSYFLKFASSDNCDQPVKMKVTAE